jgi:beta-galactosidase
MPSVPNRNSEKAGEVQLADWGSPLYRPKQRLFSIVAALCAGLLANSLSIAESWPPSASARERLSLDRGWLFHLGDIPFPIIKGMHPTYENAKAGRAWGAAAPDFDDSDWRELHLPHDWAVEGPFDPDENLAQGFRPRGIGWYRRYFKLAMSDRSKHLELQFDGIATHATVWVNGIVAHRNWSGYNSFTIDITPFARYGSELNSIAVRVDANPMEGWWYEGAGIYRHTWLVKRNAVHIATDGIHANPIRDSEGSWSIPLEVTLASSDSEPAEVSVQVALIDPAGAEVQTAQVTGRLEPLSEQVIHLNMSVDAPRLWSLEVPALYQVRVSVDRGSQVVDHAIVSCGFRTIRFDADEGFFLNEQPLKLKGVCNHQDHAGVGVAVPDSLWEFRIRRLKEMGANAYRCSHHPPAAEFLDACDRLGMLVMDENRNFNTTPEYMRQLEWLVRRDRNHPSIIMWSVFNEEPMQGTAQGYEMVRRMATLVKRLDPTRPVTAAQSNSMLNPVNASQAADVTGFNYQQAEYDRYHAANPAIPMLSSEDTSAVMTRGEYETDKERAVLNSYDTEFQPWGATHRQSWKHIAERQFVAGGFVWTGFDYHGEPQPLEWPATASSFGCLDLCGFAKTGFFIRQAFWIEDRPVLHLVPHWNWSGKQDEPIKVMAITNAESVSLSLNGMPLGEKNVGRYEMVSWDIPYEPGVLEAVAMKDGTQVAECRVATTGPPSALRLIADRSGLSGDGQDAQPITVRAVDDQGRPAPDANLLVHFALSGPGKIIGVGNGDPNCHESEKGSSRSLFNGLAQAIIQSKPGSSGPLVLTATAEGLDSAKVEILVEEAAAPAEQPAARPLFVVSNWQMSSLAKPSAGVKKGTPPQELKWTAVDASRLQDNRVPTPGVYLYRTEFQPPAAVRKRGGRVVFTHLPGKAEVWLDGELAGETTDPQQKSLAIPILAGNQERDLTVLIEASPNSKAGLGGQVIVK